MRLLLVRHGETDWNRDWRSLGQTDIPLNQVGREQARRVAQALSSERLAAIYSSPLSRALETAQGIAQAHGLSVAMEQGLMEMDAGELDGLFFPEMREKPEYAELLRRWATDATEVRFPGGENLREVQERAWAVIERIVGNHSDGSVVVVSHNFTILTILCKAIDLSLSQFRRMRSSLAGVSALDFNERGATLVLFNDTCHLEEGNSPS